MGAPGRAALWLARGRARRDAGCVAHLHQPALLFLSGLPPYPPTHPPLPRCCCPPVCAELRDFIIGARGQLPVIPAPYRPEAAAGALSPLLDEGGPDTPGGKADGGGGGGGGGGGSVRVEHAPSFKRILMRIAESHSGRAGCDNAL